MCVILNLYSKEFLCDLSMLLKLIINNMVNTLKVSAKIYNTKILYLNTKSYKKFYKIIRYNTN